MLAKKFRVRKKISFQKARIIQTQFFTLRYQKSFAENPRAGFIVSKKVSNSAVVRNRLKRRFRGCYENSINLLYDYDMLFILKKDAIPVPTRLLCQSFTNTLLDEKLVRRNI